jgi:hypothetical protein
MLRRGLALGEDAGAFERDIDPQLLPRQFRRIALGGDADLALAGVEPVLARADLGREAAVHAVVFQEMRVGRDRPEIVDPDDLELLLRMLERGAHDQAADAAETIDRNPYRHLRPSRETFGSA